MAFIRKVKTASGATAVQIAHKEHGRIIRIEHIGSAHTKEELEFLLLLARQHLSGPNIFWMFCADAEIPVLCRRLMNGEREPQ